MEAICYNTYGLLDGIINNGFCVSEWMDGLLVSHYRELGVGWSIRVVKMWDSYYYSLKHVDYEHKLLREEIYGYRYCGGAVKAGDAVFCAYKERPSFRVVVATERMIADSADNVLFPLKVITSKVIVKDIAAILNADDVEALEELLSVEVPSLELDDAEEENGDEVLFLDKTFNCGLSAIEPMGEDVDIDVEDGDSDED
jgi:hypothetical protein